MTVKVINIAATNLVEVKGGKVSFILTKKETKIKEFIPFSLVSTISEAAKNGSQ